MIFPSVLLHIVCDNNNENHQIIINHMPASNIKLNEQLLSGIITRYDQAFSLPLKTGRAVINGCMFTCLPPLKNIANFVT